MSDFEFVEITDPQTSRSFFANVETGECTWDKPTDRKVKLKNPDDDEWWELFDEHHKLPYYYNTKTTDTEWLKPATGTIIPLIAIQNSSIGKRVSVAIKRASTLNTFEPYSSGQPQTIRADSFTPQPQHEPIMESSSSSLFRIEALKVISSSSATGNKGVSISLDSHAGYLSTTNTEVPSVAQPRKGSLNQYLSKMKIPVKSSAKHANNFPITTIEQSTGSLNPIDITSQNDVPSPKPHTVLYEIGNPVPSPVAAARMNPLHGKSKKVNLRISLPADLKDHIEKFKIDGFAKKYFGEQRKGLFRRKVPLQEMLHFQKDALKKSLMVLNKLVQKDALKCFKLIQRIMGDRQSKCQPVEDLKSLTNLGILHGGLRDEIYVQVCKQLTENPDAGVFGGWQMLCVLAIAFPPSKNLEDYMKSFIRQSFNSTYPLQSSSIPANIRNPMEVLARHLDKKMEKICNVGPRGKPLTDAEIERTMEAPYRISIFGETLGEVMRSQTENDRLTGREENPIPRILPFLADAILDLKGNYSEGIFRVPGDSDAVTDLRCRIENGEYHLTGISDPNTPSSLLKLWLRELADPLLPMSIYDQCVKLGAEDGDAEDEFDRALLILSELPLINRLVVEFTINFLRTFNDVESIKATKMSPTNIAMVFAPNFLRCPSEDMTIIFENTKYVQLAHLS